MNRTSVMLFICVAGCQQQAADPHSASPRELIERISPLTAAQESVGAVKINSVGMVLVPIPAGEFVMGSPDEEAGRSPDERQHRVRITRAFYLAATEVTQGQWKSLMGTKPWKDEPNVQEGPDYPATFMSWNDAVKFCDELSRQEGMDYRLPTESEWEYACRAGTSAAYSCGVDAADLGNHGWFHQNTHDVSEAYAHSCGKKSPNLWGLFDMHGNVWEWCADWYGDYPVDQVTDPEGTPDGSHRVYRSGGWVNLATLCRSAVRKRRHAERPLLVLGFRLCLSPSRIAGP